MLAALHIQHDLCLESREAFIRFTVPGTQRTPRGMRKRLLKVPAWRGAFIDVRTIAGALLSGSWSLGRLADHLQTPIGNSTPTSTVVR